MKYLLFLLFSLTALSLHAQCLVSPPPLPNDVWGSIGPQSGTGYIRICHETADVWTTCNTSNVPQYLVPYDYSATPVFTNDTLETCDGFWIPTAEEIRSGDTTNPPPQSNAEQLNKGFLSITTALACVCFFVGLNSWETAAK